jgi:Zn-finger nucleic acid-binding protein
MIAIYRNNIVRRLFMQCPICSVELVMSERQGIEIDYCPKCRGVWLDRGELDKILEKAAPVTKQEDIRHSSPQYQDYDDHHKHRHGYKRKKSFLEELFD